MKRLKGLNTCPPFMHELLDYIMASMLCVNPNKRDTAQKVVDKLNTILTQNAGDSSYFVAASSFPNDSVSAKNTSHSTRSVASEISWEAEESSRNDRIHNKSPKSHMINYEVRSIPKLPSDDNGKKYCGENDKISQVSIVERSSDSNMNPARLASLVELSLIKEQPNKSTAELQKSNEVNSSIFGNSTHNFTSEHVPPHFLAHPPDSSFMKPLLEQNIPSQNRSYNSNASSTFITDTRPLETEYGELERQEIGSERVSLNFWRRKKLNLIIWFTSMRGFALQKLDKSFIFKKDRRQG